MSETFDENGYPSFKLIVDFSLAQLNGWRIAIAYMLAIKKKDEQFLDLVLLGNEIELFKYANFNCITNKL